MFYTIALFFVKIFLRIFFRIEIHNKKEINEDKLIVCPNHMSNFDPLVIASVIDRPVHFMAKKELFEIPIFGTLISWANAFPIDRDKPSIATLKEAIGLLKDNKIVGVFMEGTRVKEFSIEKSNPGVGMIAARSKSKVLPVKIETDYKLFSTIDIYFRDMIDPEDYGRGKDSYKEMADDILLSIYDKDRDYDS